MPCLTRVSGSVVSRTASFLEHRVLSAARPALPSICIERVDLGGVFGVDWLAFEFHGRCQFVAAVLPVDRQDREPLDLLDA